VTIRIAIIGTGVMGADHARLVAEDLPGATLQVVCDADEGRARAAADRFGAVDVGTDAEAVIARRDVDAVIVASPDATHAPLSLACIRAGRPVLCEKPLSQDPAECRVVIEAEGRAGRRLVQLGFMRRYDQSYREMKAALDEGALGRALMMHNVHRNVETPASDFTAAMAITNSAPHEFDVARFVLGTDFASITAFQPTRSGPLVAPVVMVLETVAGQVVTIEVNNNAAYGYDVRGELVGEAGAVSLQAPVYSRLDAGLTQATRHAADWRPRYGEAYRRQDHDFLRFVATGTFPEIAADAWDGFQAAVVAQAGVRALAEGRRVAVEPAARPPLYARAGRAAA
jgi:myo-inositol 2-dehydrogenase / D-chiro-inositol 1-dehydrogenase